MKPDEYERDIGPLTLDYHAQAWADMAPHVATLTRLAAGARIALELGVRGAVSTWAILDGLPASGRLTSIDAQDVVAEGIVPRRVRDDGRWTFIHGDDGDPAVRKRVPKRVDLVFIDTDHEAAHTAEELAWVHTLHPAVIALHDWWDWRIRDPGTAFAREHGYRLMTEWSPWGLGLLYR